MFVNFERMVESGITATDLLQLIAIRQRDKAVVDAISEEQIGKFMDAGYIEPLAKGGHKISKKGGALLVVIETPGITKEINDAFEKLKSLYESYGKDIGISIKEAQNRLIWFMGNTGFRGNVIIEETRQYLENNPEYTMTLCNFIWKPPSQAFSVHMNLKDSKLFDLIARRFGMNTNAYFDGVKGREAEWCFALSRLPEPPRNCRPDYLFTRDVSKEKETLRGIKMMFINSIRKIFQ